MDWKEYQQEAAAFFRSIGLEAQTDVTMQGVRTQHDVDVLVKSDFAGFEVIWIVECKHWAGRVSKLHVLALREIVSDLGADRGILLAEQGFQSGALEAAALTNVHVTSLAELSMTASNEVYSMRLRELVERTSRCRQEYWDIPKQKRIECGLRQEVGVPGYYGDRVIAAVETLFGKALGAAYPIAVDPLTRFLFPEVPAEINTVRDLVAFVEPLILDLEDRLKQCK